MAKAKNKKKIIMIIAIVCCVVLVASLITTVILLTRKKFDITPNTTVTYNDHKNMKIISLDTNYSIVNDSSPTYYSNGTVFVKDNVGRLGVFSYNENKLIIPVVHASNTYSTSSGEIQRYPLREFELTTAKYNVNSTNFGLDTTHTEEHIFKAGDATTGKIKFYNDEGTQLNVSYVDDTTLETYAYINQRKMTIKEKRKGVKISTKSKFEHEKIAIIDANYVMSYSNGGSTYEEWEIISKDNTKYTNIYKVEDKQRTLVQTINNPIGNDSVFANNQTTVVPFVLENGKIRFVVFNSINRSSYETQTILADYKQLSIYDEELDLIETVELKDNENINSAFVIGNYVYMQYIYVATEDDYDFAYTNPTDLSVMYFRYENYRLNLKNGDYDDFKFDYLIEDLNAEFNTDTIQITTLPIEDKKCEDPKSLIVNSKLKTKEFKPKIESITKITDNRYLVENSDGLYLINEYYEEICYLGNYNEYFTTKEGIMLTSWNEGYTYVVSLDGIVIKKYDRYLISNIYDDTYYLVKVKTEKDGIPYTEYYKERMGIRESNPVHSIADGSEQYTFNGTNYVSYNNEILSDGISIITRVRISTNGYAYDFYNYDGDLLLTIDNFKTENRILIYNGYSDENCHSLYISTSTAGVGYHLVVDR